MAVFVGMHTANQSVLFAFYKTIDRIAGKAELQITAGEGGFPEDVLERVQAMPEVKVAVPVIEAPVDTNLKGEGNLLILAVDMTGDRSLRDYDLESGDEAVVDDPLVFLAQPDSLIVTREFAERNGIEIGTKVPMRTMDGEKQFTVRGIMKSGGLTQAFGGNLAVMDIYAAQMVFGRGRTFDRVDLALNEGVPLAEGRAAHRAAPRAGIPGGAALVARPADRLGAARLLVHGEHQQRVRAVHRDVHHLQLVLDCRGAAAARDRDPARARRVARADPHAVPRRERPVGARRVACWASASACCCRAAWRSTSRD